MSLLANQLSGFIRRRCSVSLLEKQLLIKCQSEDDYTFLIRQKKNIESAINALNEHHKNPIQVDWITIGLINSDIVQSIPVTQIKSEVQIILPINSSDDLIRECLACNGACGIIRMSDHKGLFSNEKITYSSNAHPNDWIGKNMANWWHEDELNPYIERLMREGQLNNYSYVAKLMSGEDARLTVDARIVNFRGESARIVKTLNREILS